MKQIALSQGKFAIVDDEDYEIISKLKWHYNNCGYATHCGCRNVQLLMHREILKLQKGEFCDHINGNKLDNRKCNLRKATKSQNAMNQRLKSTNKSGIIGVSWDSGTKKWRAQIRLNGKSIYLGICSNKEDAAIIYNNKAKELFGEFAYNNRKE